MTGMIIDETRLRRLMDPSNIDFIVDWIGHRKETPWSIRAKRRSVSAPPIRENRYDIMQQQFLQHCRAADTAILLFPEMLAEFWLKYGAIYSSFYLTSRSLPSVKTGPFSMP